MPSLSVVPKAASPGSQAHSRFWPMVAFSVPLNSQCPVISEKQLIIGAKTNVRIIVFFILLQTLLGVMDSLCNLWEKSIFF